MYRGAQDFFGDDTLTLTTNDGGSTGSGGALTDSDQATIHVNTWLIGTPGDDSFTALPGNARIDALGGNDTITFDFRLVDARSPGGQHGHHRLGVEPHGADRLREICVHRRHGGHQ